MRDTTRVPALSLVLDYPMHTARFSVQSWMFAQAAFFALITQSASFMASAQPFDLIIDTDRYNTINLTKPGTTVLIDNGVTISLGILYASAIVSKAGDAWAITNRGSILSYRSAIKLNGPGSVFNEGDIISPMEYGIFAANGLSVSNALGAYIEGEQAGVDARGVLRLNNAGIIKGRMAAVRSSLSGIEDGVEIVNSGELIGEDKGIYVRSDHNSTARNYFHNLAGGRISSSSPLGVGILAGHGSNTIANDAGAFIQGTLSGIAGSDLFNMTLHLTTLNVANAGTIVGGVGAGVWSYGGGTVSNLVGGFISGAGGIAYARSLDKAENVLINAGIIEGDASYFAPGSSWNSGAGTGVYFGAIGPQTSGHVINKTGGKIQGSIFGIYSGASSSDGPVTVNNAGTISGRTGISLYGANGTIINTGSIVAGRGNPAIEFDQDNPFSNRLTLGTGSTLTGHVLGGAGTNALILTGSNTEDLSKFLNMQSLSMQGDNWILNGNGRFSVGSEITRGTLSVDGKLTTPAFTVQADATLVGTGTIVGDVVNSGTLAPGSTGKPAGTLTIDGDLTLASSSVLNYELGQAGIAGGPSNDLIEVSGNLTLDGTLNVAESVGGAYGPGIYRLFNYGGTFNDNGLVLGSMPAGSDNSLVTTVPGQVNLVNRAGLYLSFWDGAAGPKFNGVVDGGDGIWQASGNSNWTDVTGKINDAYANGSFATFSGSPGTVTVDNSLGNIVSAGMQFATNGYRIQGNPITLSLSNNIIRVGDGTAAGAGYTATIDSELGGSGGLEKTDQGTLVLAGANSYTGSTIISGGVLQTGAANVLAQSSDVLINSAGTLTLNGYDQTLNRLSGDGSVLLGSATLTANNASSIANSDFKGTLSGSGGLVKIGEGTLTLAGAGSQIGSVDVQQGTLRFKHGDAFTTMGDFTTQAGASIEVGSQATTLAVGGAFTQTSGSNLDLTIGASPDITAQTAHLDGSLTVKGFDASAQPVRASDIQAQTYTALHTTDGITGDFVNNPLANIGPDYLPAMGAISADGKDYNLGFQLAWTQGGQALGTGSFTLAQGTAFDVDQALVNQTGAFDSGWDGKSLTKSGEGLLILSSSGNSYSGSTTLNRGVLRTGAANVFAQSSDVVVNNGATLDLDGYDQIAQRLTGAGVITLGNGVLTANNATVADNTTFTGSIAGEGGLTKTGEGELTLSGETLYRGDTHVQGGQLVLDGSLGGGWLQSNIIGMPGSALVLRDGAALTGSIDSLDLSVEAASAWSIATNSVVNKLSNAGRIGFTAPPLPMSQSRTLTVDTLQGLGGSIDLYAVLGDSGSLTDQVVIDGGVVTGISVLNIHNAGGLGDQTTGNGIPIVIATNGGTTSVSAFDLGGPVLAGAYRYSLKRGGIGAPEDWFLVSNKGNGQPDYRAETSLYSVLQTQAIRYSDAVLGSFHDRHGASADLEPKRGQRAWMRVIGQKDRINGADNGLQAQNVRNEANITALQFGGDLYRKQLDDLFSRTGWYGAVGQSKGWADHVGAVRARAGESDFTGYSFGLYSTWLDGQDSYLDAVLQSTYYDIKSRSSEGMRLSTGGYGLAASLEAGSSFELTPNQTLQPQVQLVYQHLSLRDASDAASRVMFPSTDTVLLRLGSRLNKDLQLSEQSPGTVWASADLLLRLGKRTRTRFSTPTQGDVGFRNDLPGTTLRLQTGTEGLLRKNIMVNAQIGVERSINRSGLTNLNAQIELKVSF